MTAGQALGQTDDANLLYGNVAPDEEINVRFDIGSFNRYIWRGLILTDGPVLQPAVTVGRGDMSVNVWGNMDLDEINGNGGQFNELDVTLAWEKKLGSCDLSAGAINYNFPNTAAAATTELYVGAAFDIPTQPSVTAYFDIAETKGSYVTFDVAHAFSSESDGPMEWKLELSTGIGLGSAENNNLYFGSATSGVTDFHLGLSFAVTIGSKWTVSQSINYISVVDDQLKAMVAKDHSSVYGVNLTVVF